MRKGVSPVVAVVLLIAISVVAAVGLYFWSAGLATKQPTTDTPISIYATPIGGGQVLIANLGSGGPFNASELLFTAGGLTWGCEGDGMVQEDEQILCNISGFTTLSWVMAYAPRTSSTIIYTEEAEIYRTPDGGACGSDDDCMSGFCDDGTCSTHDWGPVELVSDDSTGSSWEPAVAFGSGPYITWYDFTAGFGGGGAINNILFQYWNGTGWEGYVNSTDAVSWETTGGAFYPSIGAESGKAYIAWYDDSAAFGAAGEDILFRYWDGATWGGYVNTTDLVSAGTTTTSWFPAMAVENGKAYTAWTDLSPAFGGADWDILFRYWNGTAWEGYVNSTDVVSGESTGGSVYHEIAVDNGKAYVVWRDSTAAFGGADNDILFRYWNGTAWTGYVNSTDVISGESAASSDYPMIAVDNGKAYVTWYDLEAAFGGADTDVVFRYWNGTAWTGYVNTTDLVSHESTGSSVMPSIAIENGKTYITWHDATAAFGGADNDILFRYWNGTVWGGLVNSTDLISSNSTLNSQNPMIAVDNGEIYITWDDLTAAYGGADMDILTRRYA